MPAAPAPQLPYAQAPYLGASIQRQPKVPHLWQQALTQFLGGAAGDVGKNAIAAGMSPKAITAPDGTVSFAANQPWYKAGPTTQQQLEAAGTNAGIKEAAARAAQGNATAGNIAARTPGEVANLGATAGKTGAETANIAAMTPAQVAETQARANQGNAGADYTKQLAQWVGPQALGGLREQGARANNMDAVTQWMGPQAQAGIAKTGAEAGLLGAQQGLTQAQIPMTGTEAAQKALQLQLMQRFLQNPSAPGATSPFSGASSVPPPQ